MGDVFIRLLNMSISAAWTVAAVALLRLLLKKAPKYISCLLWILVAVRLICPVSIESVLSLIPSAETVPPEIVYQQMPQIHTGVSFINSAVNPVIGDTLAPAPGNSLNPLQVITEVSGLIWVVGLAAMLIYALASYIRIAVKVKISAPLERGIYLCDNVDTPFILGIFRPRIYLPSEMDGGTQSYVISHEKAHIKRLDHIWKPLGFLLLSVYWFNPVLWLGYILLCRDIELACDEKVVHGLTGEEKKGYSAALLSCSIPKRMITACPLAFGEVGVKQRIKSILNYKKPAFWVIAIAVTVTLVAAVCLLTDPVSNSIPDSVKLGECDSDAEGVTIEIVDIDLKAQVPTVTVKWKNSSLKRYLYGESFNICRKAGEEWRDQSTGERYFTTIGIILEPLSHAEKTYTLHNIDLSKAGDYRFEATLSLDRKQYIVTAEFQLAEGVVAVSVTQYEVTKLVYDCGIYSFVMNSDIAADYRLSQYENGFILQEKYETDLKYVDIAFLEKTKLNDENFVSLLELAPIWRNERLSAEKLIKENEQAYCSVEGSDGIYIFLRQKNGDIYLCIGYNNVENPHIRFIFKLKETELKDIPYQKTMIYKGMYYTEAGSFFGSLPGGYEYEDVISEKMANDSGLEGKAYYTNDEEQGNIFVEEKDGELHLWVSARAGIELGEAVSYACLETADFMVPTVFLYPETGRFTFNYSGLSSYIPVGEYTVSGNILILRSAGGDEYVFTVRDGSLVFDAKRSEELPKYKYSPDGEPQYPFNDGAVFGPMGVNAGGDF